MCSTAAHQPSEVVRLWRSTYANRYRAVELNTFSRRNRMSHALLAREAEGLKRSSAAYLVSVRGLESGSGHEGRLELRLGLGSGLGFASEYENWG